jgi:hypothetical protein
MLDSVKTILRNRDGERHQFFVLFAEGTVGKHVRTQVTIAAQYASRSAQDYGIQLLFSPLAVRQPSHLLPPTLRSGVHLAGIVPAIPVSAMARSAIR